MNGLLYRATLSSFRLKFDSKGFAFFDAAVQFFEQDRHLKWDIRSHRASARYWMAMVSRCSKQHVSFHTVKASKVGQRAVATDALRVTGSKSGFRDPVPRRAVSFDILRNTVFLGEGSVHQLATV
jgi:hypothetical protein